MLGCLLPATGALAIASTNEELRHRSSGHLFMVLVAIACGLAGALGAIVFRLMIRFVQGAFFQGAEGISALVDEGEQG